MSVIPAQEIRRRLRLTSPESRLFIAPLLEPSEQLRDGQASIDVRLGLHFTVLEASVRDVVDTLSPGRREAPQRMVFVPLGEYLVLHPHQFILGQTLEFVRLPADLMCYVVGRSSWGRQGLIVATAVGVHPFYSGPITLEFRNLGEVPIKLYPGDLIAQLFFHRLTKPVKFKEARNSSHLSGLLNPEQGSHRYGTTRDVLRRIAAGQHGGSAAPR